MAEHTIDRREFLAGATAGLAAAAHIGELRAAPRHPTADNPLAWWQAARFGMFVHFGLYSIPGGEWNGKPVGTHEWIRHNAKIPDEEYIRLADQFNPTGFDADALAALAKTAGQKYLVFTTKHHDGFALFDSRHTGYDVMSTPYRRDIARDVVEACRRHGITPCWYYSIMDWHHPDYLPRRDWEVGQRPVGGAEFSRYVEFLLRQLEELLTRYGDIGLLWFDGQWEETWTHQLGETVAARCRALSPGIIINNRVDKAGPNPSLPAKYAGGSDQWRSAVSAGDYSTPELGIPDTGVPGEPWESCITMNDNWGYSKFDTNFKSPARLIEILVETASKGGNLLLNVGPDGEGRVPLQSVEALHEIGAWMRRHGSAIYGTTASPLPEAPVRITALPDRLHLFIPAAHQGELRIPLGEHTVQRVEFLGYPAHAAPQWRLVDRTLVLDLPSGLPDPICSVLAVHR